MTLVNWFEENIGTNGGAIAITDNSMVSVFFL